MSSVILDPRILTLCCGISLLSANQSTQQALSFVDIEEVFADVTEEEYEKAIKESDSMEKKWRLFKK
jgi:hypothetical protein